MSETRILHDVTIPAQIRAGRALLDWSQEQLAEAADIKLSAVQAFESARSVSEFSEAGRMRVALERKDIVFLASNEDDGPGVRLVGAQPNIIRRPNGADFYRQVGFAVEWRGQKILVQLLVDILNDLDGTNHQTNEQVVASFDRHWHKISAAIVAATSDESRFRPNLERGMLQLAGKDFPAAFR